MSEPHDSNPYHPVSGVDQAPAKGKWWWLRSALILNATLLALPIFPIATLYVFDSINSWFKSRHGSGDPVHYESHYELHASPWFVVGYFTIPNMFLLLAMRSRGIWK